MALVPPGLVTVTSTVPSVRAGDTVYLAGQVSKDPAGDVHGQTVAVLKQIDDLLARAGSSKEKILSATIYLADMSRFADLNKAWEAWVAPGHAPAATFRTYCALRHALSLALRERGLRSDSSGDAVMGFRVIDTPSAWPRHVHCGWRGGQIHDALQSRNAFFTTRSSPE